MLSVDGAAVVAFNDIEDVALPVYEGRMLGQYDFAEKGWVSGQKSTSGLAGDRLGKQR